MLPFPFPLPSGTMHNGHTQPLLPEVANPEQNGANGAGGGNGQGDDVIIIPMPVSPATTHSDAAPLIFDWGIMGDMENGGAIAPDTVPAESVPHTGSNGFLSD
jgi:hypothetical protein